MAAVPVRRRYALATAWMVATLAFGASAFGGQGMRFFPIRVAQLGSDVGTVGDPVTPQFNADLGCWELQLPAGTDGFEVDLDLQVFGWGSSNCRQPTGLCRVDPGDACTLPSDCRSCNEDADCTAGTCTDNGATCLEADNTGSGDPCINNADCTQGTETCRGRLAPCSLGAIQGSVNSAGYSNGVGGELNPKGWPDDRGHGAYQAKLWCDPNFGGDGSPCNTGPFGPCGAGICIQNPDWVMPPCTTAILAINTSVQDYAWAAAATVDCNEDDGQVKTLGGLILEVPIDAAGTYMIDFVRDPNLSFMSSGSGGPIPGVVFTPACITLVCQSDADCDDGISCTTDTCDEATSTCENIIAPNSCLIDDICYANGQLDPGQSCRLCSSNTSQTDWSNRLAGFACGDATDTGCDNPDTCDGAGACLDNFETTGSSCGDPSDSDCDLPDTCDGEGTCQTTVAPNGTPCTDDGNDCTSDFCTNGRCRHSSSDVGTRCGDATDIPCDAADTCDGSGNCLSNVLPNDTPCPNGIFCDGGELCLGGVCQSADPPCAIETDLCDEQDDECDLLGDFDGDLLVTQSDFSHWPDCETGPVGGPFATGCEIFDFEQNGFVDLRDYARFQSAFTMP